MELVPNHEPVPGKLREKWEKAGSRTRLAAYRRRRQVRQEDLAEAAGMSLATLQRIESGTLGADIQIRHLLSLAVALNLPLPALIEDAWIMDAERRPQAPKNLAPPERTYVLLPHEVDEAGVPLRLRRGRPKP